LKGATPITSATSSSEMRSAQSCCGHAAEHKARAEQDRIDVHLGRGHVHVLLKTVELKTDDAVSDTDFTKQRLEAGI
jgi:hypothetical protein